MLVQTKQIRINVHKRNNTKKKHNANIAKHSKYKYTYYQRTHTLQNPHIHTPTHITKQVKTTTVQVKTNTVQIYPNETSQYNQYPQFKVTLMYMTLLSRGTSP